MSGLGEEFFAWQAQYRPREYLLACSGGVDSIVLLHELHDAKARLSAPLRVIYINHGWHEQAAAWGELVQKTAYDYGFSCQIVPLNLPKQGNAEAQAREARYAVFAQTLAERGVLLTAHHQDDQAETFLLNLLRGSGIEGLSAMPARRVFAQGEHWRPLLTSSRADLEHRLALYGLNHVCDDSNADIRYRRNWLRHEVLPLLQSRYPQAIASIAQSAAHVAEARGLQEQWLDGLLSQHQTAFPLAPYRDKPLAQLAIFLRRWLVLQALPLPPRARLQEFLRQIAAGADYAAIEYAQTLLYYYDDAIHYLSQQAPSAPPSFALTTDWAGIGRLEVQAGHELLRGKDCRWTLYPPAQAFRPVGKRHAKPLKEWLRLARIAPPLRRRLPLLWVDGQLAWAGELGAATAFAQLVLLWHRKPNSDTIAR